MTGNDNGRLRFGFTLTELLVVIGLIAVLMSLLLPAMGKARAAANSATCLSNLHQLGMGWTMYIAENKGRLPDFVWSIPIAPDVAWSESWPGILDNHKVRGEALLCPSANEPYPYMQVNNRGFGNATHAWTGLYMNIGCGARFNATTYRDGSYGYNHYLTAGNGFGQDSKGVRITEVHGLDQVPVFLDSVAPHFLPPQMSAGSFISPPNLHWEDYPASDATYEHWRFLIARHGRAINGYMADGSARPIALEDTYMLTWKTGWNKYKLTLPPY